MLIFVNDFLVRRRLHWSACQSNMNTHYSALTTCSFSTWLYQLDFLYIPVHLTDCKFKLVYSFFYAHLWKMTFSCVCVYTVLFVNLIWILIILLWLLIHFQRDYQLDFLYILSVHISQCVRFKFVYPFIYAHLCENYFLLRLCLHLFCLSI